jgi:hypothetical protein
LCNHLTVSANFRPKIASSSSQSKFANLYTIIVLTIFNDFLPDGESGDFLNLKLGDFHSNGLKSILGG